MAASSPDHSPLPLHHLGALCSTIGAGELDADLSELIASINARTTAIATARTADALSRLHVGGRVRLSQRVKPNYLRGELRTIHEYYGDAVVVLLDRVVGRFSSRHVRCSPEVLELVAET